MRSFSADSADVNEIIAAALQATYMDKPFVKVLANDMPDLQRNPIKPDLGWLVSTKPAHVAEVFTRNTFPAALVQIKQQVLRRNKPVYAIFVNSVNANAFMGATGLANT
nr:bifunctional ornithine acetyltransferase/N-acetylglutamate synthase [Weissella cibaria]